MNKPVVAVTSLGGAAKDIYESVLHSKYEQFERDVTANEFKALRSAWTSQEAGKARNETMADNIIAVVHKLLTAYNQPQKATTSALWLVGITIVASILIWVGVYIVAGTCSPDAATCDVHNAIAFFVLLYISALEGLCASNVAVVSKQ